MRMIFESINMIFNAGQIPSYHANLNLHELIKKKMVQSQLEFPMLHAL